MKGISTALTFLFLFMVFFLSSCTVNQFSTRKNYQPRVRVEAPNLLLSNESVNLKKPGVELRDSIHSIQPEASVLKMQNQPITHQKKSKETIQAKVIKVFFPKKKEILAPVLHPPKRKLNEAKQTKMEGTQIAGLVIGIMSLALAITAAFMIIGMATGNIWAYFITGMLLAVVAIILGIVGKFFPWRGFAIAGLVIGIIVVVALLAMLIVFTVLGIL